MSRRTEKNVGVIGLGIIGQRVAGNLRRRGFSVFVWNRTPKPFPNFVGSPAEIAQLCDYIQIFVSDDEALLEMVQQLKQTLKAHHIVMAHSTVAPHTMRAAAEIVHRRGAQFLDAPFTGSKIASEKGELIYYIGGDDAAFKRARPVLEASSKEIIEIGEIGQATLIKIATNMVTATTVQVAAEALALVHSSGLGLDKFVAAMRGNASNSPVLSLKLPKMIEGDFDPHFSVKHMLKDVQIASRLAHSCGLTLGATETARSSLLAEARQGRGDDDFCSIVRGFFPDGPVGSPEPETAEPEHLTLALDEAAEEAPKPMPEVMANPDPSQGDAPELDSQPAPEESTVVEYAIVETAVGGELDELPQERSPEHFEVADVEATPDVSEAKVEEPPRHEEIEPVRPEPAPVEEERRGFFSRMFGKGPDY